MIRARLPALLAAVFIASSTLAQVASSPGPFQGFKSTDKDPVEINADRMEADLSSGRLRFIGHVRAKQGARTIYAQRMDVRYTDAGKITSIKAKGHVKVKMGGAFATADRLELDNARQVIYLRGSPKVVQGKQIITGEKITYRITTEELIVTKPRIEWRQDKGEKP